VPRELTFDLLLHRQNFWQVRLLLVYLFVPAKKLVTFFCHSGLDIANKKSIEREIEEAKREAQRMKLEAKRNFRQKVIDFMENHSL
jgi:hypothetical protein